jgi:hypothetical protein
MSGQSQKEKEIADFLISFYPRFMAGFWRERVKESNKMVPSPAKKFWEIKQV